MPEPARTGAVPAYLHAEEHERLLRLRLPKRRNDWLLGRWTAKRLLQTVVWETDGVMLPLDMITIGNNPDGVPSARLPMSNHQHSISISHSHGRAFAAAIGKPDAPIGADMERIESRPDGFVEAYLTPEEQQQLAVLERVVWSHHESRFTGHGLRDMLITAVWSAKEAVLKALHLGLSVDTRSVSCLIELVDHQPQAWRPFVIRFEGGCLRQPASPLTGWWRVEDGFVLTIVVG